MGPIHTVIYIVSWRSACRVNCNKEVGVLSSIKFTLLRVAIKLLYNRLYRPTLCSIVMKEATF